MELLLPRSELESLWTATAAELGLARVGAVVVEGSIAEGLGNARSDVDFRVVTEESGGGAEDPVGSFVHVFPSILFVGGRRVEVRQVSSRSIVQTLRHLVDRVSGDDGLREVTWELLDRCQRFQHCLTLDGAEVVRPLLALLKEEQLRDVTRDWWRIRAADAARYACTMLAMEQPLYAHRWMRTALFYAAKSYAAARGETYMGQKWLGLQLERTEGPTDLVHRFWELHDASAAEVSPAHYVTAAGGLIAELVGHDPTSGRAEIRVALAADVLSWRIGGRQYLVRARADVFALGPEAAALCEALLGNGGVLDLAAVPEARRCLAADLFRFGLVDVLWPGGERVVAPALGLAGQQRRPTTPLPRATPSPLAASGPWQGPQITLEPLPARRFVESGIECLWANILVENAREDAVGALSSKQYRVLEASVRKMARTAADVLWFAGGMSSRPPDVEATLEVVRAFDLPDDLATAILACENARITGENAQAQLEAADRVVQELRRRAGIESFPESFESSGGWTESLLRGFGWVQACQDVGAELPLQEAQGIFGVPPPGS